MNSDSSLRQPRYARHAAATETPTQAKCVSRRSSMMRRMRLPRPAPTKAHPISMGPPPSRKTNDAHAAAEARPTAQGA